MNLGGFLKLSFVAVALTACSSDDDSVTPDIVNPDVVNPGVAIVDPNLVVPEEYAFVDEEGNSTVSFSGQTTRLQQGEEILESFLTFGTTEESLNAMFGEGSGFVSAELESTKNIRSKTAASDDYFALNTSEQNTIQMVFDGFISSQVATFLGAYESKEVVPVATAGNPGILGNRLVNADGLEYNQAFNKGLVGALTLDQIVNNYLTRCLKEEYQTANTNGELDDDNNYTTLEHFWDEAYGYVYGNSENDSFLFKYINRVNNDEDFNTYAADIELAFRTGRAAIVANNYEVVEEQVIVLQKLLSEVIAIRAVYYLQQGKLNLASVDTINDGSAFHDLSEGYGFVYSLRFTRDSETGNTFFSREMVDGFIEQLEAGNGFWDIADDTTVLDTISETIAAKFDFTVEEAATLSLFVAE